MRILNLAPTTAGSLISPVVRFPFAPRALLGIGAFNWGSGGTSLDAWLQTSLDGGSTYFDIANIHVLAASLKQVFNLSSLTPVTALYTPTDATLAANTVKDGLLGRLFRVKTTSVGVYATTTFTLDIQGDYDAGAPVLIQ